MHRWLHSDRHHLYVHRQRGWQHLKKYHILSLRMRFDINHMLTVLKVMPALKSLRLDRSHIDDDEAMLLAEALNQLPRLTQVQLQGKMQSA
eukprot:4396569-Amphidinium_carterae.1